MHVIVLDGQLIEVVSFELNRLDFEALFAAKRGDTF